MPLRRRAPKTSKKARRGDLEALLRRAWEKDQKEQRSQASKAARVKPRTP